MVLRRPERSTPLHSAWNKHSLWWGHFSNKTKSSWDSLSDCRALLVRDTMAGADDMSHTVLPSASCTITLFFRVLNNCANVGSHMAQSGLERKVETHSCIRHRHKLKTYQDFRGRAHLREATKWTSGKCLIEGAMSELLPKETEEIIIFLIFFLTPVLGLQWVSPWNMKGHYIIRYHLPTAPGLAPLKCLSWFLECSGDGSRGSLKDKMEQPLPSTTKWATREIKPWNSKTEFPVS